MSFSHGPERSEERVCDVVDARPGECEKRQRTGNKSLLLQSAGKTSDKAPSCCIPFGRAAGCMKEIMSKGGEFMKNRIEGESLAPANLNV